MPEKTLFIITTDGMENASHRYTYDKVRHMIERQKERYGWEFLFLGANIDAAAEAGRFGIDESMAANYHCDEVGTALNYEVISEAITSVRACAAPLSADWKKEGYSFEDVIRTAVSLGGDCDTLTAIAGSIAEGFYGVPAELKEECYKRLPEPLF